MLCLCCAIVPGAATSGRTVDGERTDAEIDRYVAATMHSARIPGLALAIVESDRIVYLKGYGRADPSGRPVTPQTPFMIGSITKPFTALAVMQLVDAGRIELDAPVQRYIPWFRVADPRASAQITVRQMLTMTSGLPQSYETQLWTDRDDGALERVVRLLGTTALARRPGAFGYSNANYDTLGLLVQIVSGLSYEAYVRQQIFAPLEMRTSFLSQDEAMAHGMASGYRWWFGIPVPATFPFHRAELPAGYIISSAEDMGRFLIAQMNGGCYGDRRVLSAEGMTLMHREPARGTYGIGWESLRASGHRLIGHDGGTPNFQSSVFFDPDARVGVFVAANVMNALDTFSSPSGASPLDGLTARDMAQRVLALAADRPVPPPGRGHERLTIVFDLAVLILTGVLVSLLVRLHRRGRLLVHRGIDGWRELTQRVVMTAVVFFTLPVTLLYLALAVPAWTVIFAFQPDLGYWLEAVAIVRSSPA